MEKTIKEDQKRKVIKSTLLNDNTLLEVVEKEDKIIITIRFVKSRRQIEEHVLLSVDRKTFEEHGEELIEINDEKNAIAIFKPGEDKTYYLDQVYDLKEHEYGISEFIDIIYQRAFPTHPLKEQYVKVKRTKEG